MRIRDALKNAGADVNVCYVFLAFCMIRWCLSGIGPKLLAPEAREVNANAPDPTKENLTTMCQVSVLGKQENVGRIHEGVNNHAPNGAHTR